jgi:hypothetical protein
VVASVLRQLAAELEGFVIAQAPPLLWRGCLG